MPNDIPPLERRETRRLARAPRASPAAPCAAAPTSVRKVAPERRLADPRGHDLPVDLLRLAVPGIAGTKGFGGGFPGAEIPDFGEPLLREVYAETLREVAALEEALEAVAGCHRRVVLLHYAPLSDTIVGEPEGIWSSSRSDGCRRQPGRRRNLSGNVLSIAVGSSPACSSSASSFASSRSSPSGDSLEPL